MTDTPSQRPAADLSDLRDDGGRPLPATPLEMLSQARRTRTRRRITTAAVSGVAALVLIAGGMAFAAQLDKRAIETAVTPPSVTETPTPAPSLLPIVKAEEFEAATAAVESALRSGEGDSYETRPEFRDSLAWILQDPSSYEITVAGYAGDNTALFGAAAEALRSGGYSARGISLKTKTLSLTHGEVEKLFEDVTGETQKLQRAGVRVGVTNANDDKVRVEYSSGAAKVREALKKYGTRVELLYNPVIGTH